MCVGDPGRAERLKKYLDEIVVTRVSNRGFTTITGKYKGKMVTIISIGMGLPMMDFMVRECMYVVDGPTCIIRLGTCGTPHPDVEIGTFLLADESIAVTTNYDAFHGEGTDYYNVSLPIKGDKDLVETVCIVYCSYFSSKQNSLLKQFLLRLVPMQLQILSILLREEKITISRISMIL